MQTLKRFGLALGLAILTSTAAMAQQAPATPYADPAGATAGGDRLNHLIERIEAKEFGIGPFSAVRDANNARILGGSKLDFIIIDMEHNPYDAETLKQFIYNMRALDGSFPVTPVVRIPINGREAGQNQWVFKQLLDAGAMGIMLPQVNSAEDAMAAVRAMRFPPVVDDAAPEPRGQRGYGGPAGAWGLGAADYVAKADLWPLDPQGELVLIVQIETVEAIENFEEIMAVPGVGAAFVGPADLHADMGYVGQSGVAEVEEKIREVGAKARDLGAYLGIIGNASDWEKRRDEGYMFISGSDQGVSSALTNDLNALGR